MSSIAFGQDFDNQNLLKKNSFSFNAGSIVVGHGIGVNYQRIFPKFFNFFPFKQTSSVVSVGTKLNHYENTLMGYLSIERVLFPYISYGLITNVERKNHFEIYLGLCYRHEITPYPAPNTILPVVKFGYRYQAPQKNLVFTCGLGSVDLLYVGLGYAF